MSSPKYSIGSPMFVKMRGYTAWPAKIEGIADQTPGKVKYHIFFYGTNQIAVCKEDEMRPYLKFREMLGKPKKVKGFNKAILQMDSELGLVSDISAIKRNKESGHCESNLSTVGMEESGNCQGNLSSVAMEESNDVSDIALDESIETPSEPQNKNKISNPHNQSCYSDYDILSALKLEHRLEQIHYGIQSSLDLRNPDPEACLQCLHELAQTKFNKLTLKKHPEVVYTLFKVQNYVGNTSNWKMTDNDIEIFKSQAEKIQNKSKLICDQIKVLFQAPQGVSFLDYFESELITFKNHTKNMSLSQYFRLMTDPTDA